jgi:hypothetical protein
MRRLLHRWFSEYNPLYLLSAALVLIGVMLITRDLAQAGSVYGQLGVAAIAEVYAWTLIAGAALLMRLGLRRPAVMLALLTVIYQSDLSLHTETCAHLAGIGALAVGVWLSSFYAKLHALAWALRLRLSKSAVAIPTLGALGLAALPWCFSVQSPVATTPLVLGWLFLLLASALWTRREVESAEPLDDWARTVLGRALRATWSLWAAMTVFHLLLWSSERGLNLAERGLELGVLIPMASLLATRWLRRELSIWCTAIGTLIWVAIAMPSQLSLTLAMAAVVLGLRALRRPVQVKQTSEPPPVSSPYRAPGPDAPPSPTVIVDVVFAFGTRAEMLRLLTGSLFACYLSLWTIGWQGGAWPEHILALDLLLATAVGIVAWRARARLVLLVPLSALCFQFGVQTGLITAPGSKLEWGALSVALGFVLLLGSLFASWRVRRLQPRDTG